MQSFLSKFLTPTEIQMLAKRLELLKLAGSDLEVSELRRLLHIAKVTIYEWFEKYDAHEDDFQIIVDRLKELDAKRIKLERLKREALTRVPKRASVGVELLKIGAEAAYKGYKKPKECDRSTKLFLL